MNKVKIGIIGTGFSATFHMEALRRLFHVEVVAVAGRTETSAAEFAEAFGIPKAYTSAEALIADAEVEAIHNCTPNDLHYEINKKVLLAGKHLLSEKPLASNSRESAELVELARRSAGVSAVCFNYRHYPLVQHARELLADNRLGPVHMVHGVYLQDWLLYKTDYNWRLEAEGCGGARAIADIGSHWCDLLQHVLGLRVVEVFADLKTVHPIRHRRSEAAATFGVNGRGNQQANYEEVPIVTEDCGSVLVHFEGGITGVFSVSQVHAGRKNKLSFEIAAQDGTIVWDQEDANRIWIGHRNKPNAEWIRDPELLGSGAGALSHYPGGHQEGWPDGMKNLLISFYDKVMEIHGGNFTGQAEMIASLEDGHYIMKIIEAIVESNRTKQWIRIE